MAESSAENVLLQAVKELQKTVAEMQSQIHELSSRPPARGQNPLSEVSGTHVPPPADSGTSRRTADIPLSSFSLEEAAASWGSGREVKVKPFPPLGMGKGELPYGTWKYHVLAALDAAQLNPVLLSDFPEDQSAAIRGYYRTANTVIYHALMTAVQGIHVLGDTVVRLYGMPSSARSAWLAIKAHYVRLSASNRTYLLSTLQKLEPLENETMEAFLGRCAKLQMEFSEYGLVLEDELLITQVLGKLSIQWKSRAGLDRPLETLSWLEVSSALQTEDNARRQSNTKSPEALLPLGWTRRFSANAFPVTDSLESVSADPECGCGQNAYPAGYAFRGYGPSRPKPQGERNFDPSQIRVPVVCWHCQQVGHNFNECPNLPAGWKPSPEDKAKGQAAREELRRRRLQAQKDRAAHVARADQSPAPSEGKCSQTL
jgi:hypothetical protein